MKDVLKVFYLYQIYKKFLFSKRLDSLHKKDLEDFADFLQFVEILANLFSIK